MIEEEIFKHYKLDRNALLNYGFIWEQEGYYLEKSFMEGEFLAKILVHQDSSVSAKVIEVLSQEEYLPLRVYSQAGSFVMQVRESYEALLLDIREQCFQVQSFGLEQTKRIIQRIDEVFSDQPEYPFRDASIGTVFRNKRNEKWYLVLLRVDRKKIKTLEALSLEKEEKERKKREREEAKRQGKKLKREKKSVNILEREDLVDVIDLKLPEDRVRELLAVKGYYPAYHMNKKSWISIILDGTLTDEEVFHCIEESYHIVSQGASGKKKEIHTWLIPANPKYYDIVKGFSENKVLTWKQSSAVHVGDILYMYVGQPNSAILYRTRAIEVDIPYQAEDEIEKTLNLHHIMKLELLETYESDIMPHSLMIELGVRYVRGPRTMPMELIEAIEKRKEMRSRKDNDAV